VAWQTSLAVRGKQLEPAKAGHSALTLKHQPPPQILEKIFENVGVMIGYCRER
jgi:hypothetical protein